MPFLMALGEDVHALRIKLRLVAVALALATSALAYNFWEVGGAPADLQRPAIRRA
jgi:hypothetical protein